MRPRRPDGSIDIGEAALLRASLVGLFIIAAAVTALRLAFVSAWAERDASAVQWMWADHPDVLRSAAMRQIGAAAASSSDVAPATEALLRRLARAAPLSPEPLLVAGAQAIRNGDLAIAEQRLIQARNRDPRAPAARFLLADLYLRNGRIAAALDEMSAIARLVPATTGQLALQLADFAKVPGSESLLRPFLARNPGIEEALLKSLARDPANSAVVLRLARRDSPGSWQGELLHALVTDGQYERAFAIWAGLSGVDEEQGRGLYNARFETLPAPPPFNWRFASAAGGVAEPTAGGLSVLYYRREDLVLASQLMLLRPGAYALAARLSGPSQSGPGLGWSLVCLPSGSRILGMPLASSGERPVAQPFTVPASGCTAQRLELEGRAGEPSTPLEATIASLSLRRIGR